MVLAARVAIEPSKDTLIASHPAPADLAQVYSNNTRLVDSNAKAAVDCSLGKVDCCITTLKAAESNNLIVIKDFGEVPMCFTVHARK